MSALLDDIAAAKIIMRKCVSRYCGCSFEDDLDNREIRFAITHEGVRLLAGVIAQHPSGFPVKFIKENGSLTLTTVNGLEQFLDEQFRIIFDNFANRVVEESYQLHRCPVRVAMCPDCLRCHDPDKPINCECGYQSAVLTHRLENCALPDLINLRDRLNEIIYDKERGG